MVASDTRTRLATLRKQVTRKSRVDGRGVVVPLALAALVLVGMVYSAAFTAHYGFLDDYSNLRRFQDSPYETLVFDVSQGRFSLAAFYPVYVYISGGVGDLLWWRALGAASAGLLAITAWVVLRAATGLTLASWMAGVTLACIPAVSLFVTWASLWSFTLGAALSFAAAYLFFFKFCERTTRGVSRHGSILAFVTAAILWVFCIGVYQPVGLVVPVVLLFLVMLRARSTSQVLRLCVACAVLTGVVAVIYLIALRFFILVLGTSLSSRAAVPVDPMEKIEFILREALPRVLWPWVTNAATLVAVVLTGTFIVVGVIGLRRGLSASHRALNVGLVVVALIITMVPMMLTSEDWPSSRIRIAGQVWLVLFLYAAVIGWASLVDHVALRRWRALIIPGLMAALMALVVAHAVVVVRDYMVVPQAREYALVREAVGSLRTPGGAEVRVEPAQWTDTLAPNVLFDEFGLPSSAAPWVPVPMAELAWAEVHSGGAPRFVFADPAGAVASDAVTIRFADVIRERSSAH